MSSENLPEAILRTKDGSSMPLEGVNIQGTLRGFAAEITVEQHYRNTRKKNIEAVYTFPLPIGAVLLDVELEIGERRLRGQVVEKKAAEERYEDAITSGDTALMIEVTGPGLYTLNFGNLLAGETAVIRYRYAVLLSWQGDRVRLVLPTTLAPRYGDPVKAGLAPHQVPETSLVVSYPLKLSLTVEGQLAEGEVSCPTHMITTTRSETGLSIKLGDSATLDRDFVLLMRGCQESAACVFDQPEREKVILASMRIPPLPKRDEKPLRLKVVIDCSGSMAGISIAQARKAALEILNQLRPGDLFNITLFGSSVRHFWADLVPAEARYITMAWQQLESLDANLGGTETGAALHAVYGLGQKRSKSLFGSKARGLNEKGDDVATGAQPQILLITDGQVWEYEEIIKEAVESNHRVFTVGVGLSAVEGLVGELATKTGGACELVSPQEGMTERILSQFYRLRQPRMTLKGLKLGVTPKWFTPLSKAVFAGDTVHVYAGIDGDAPNTVSLGAIDSQGNAIKVEAAIGTSNWSELPRMAAAARIASPKATQEEKLQLALESQLLTDQTNYLIVAERSEKVEDLPMLAKVPHMLPAGWGGTGSVQVACNIAGAVAGGIALFSPSRARNSRVSNCVSGGISKYDIPAFLRKQTDDYEEQPALSVIFDSNGHIKVGDAVAESPQHFIANLYAGMPGFQNPDKLPNTVEALEDFGLPTELATALREISSEGWTERVIVAALLMAMTQLKHLSAEFPREFSRLIFANWKRTGTNQLILDRVTTLIARSIATDWVLDLGEESALGTHS
jgi:Ca-activated chloride channel family protein